LLSRGHFGKGLSPSFNESAIGSGGDASSDQQASKHRFLAQKVATGQALDLCVVARCAGSDTTDENDSVAFGYAS
jgi:hypothetical protein